MKRYVFIALSAMTLLLAGSLPGQAAHFRGGIWIGPVWGPGWWGPGYPYYGAPPVIIQQQPELYFQPAPQPREQGYWYYCQDPQGYYPYVKNCPMGWMKVVPSPPPSHEKE